jgi:hypothetical protein
VAEHLDQLAVWRDGHATQPVRGLEQLGTSQLVEGLEVQASRLRGTTACSLGLSRGLIEPFRGRLQLVGNRAGPGGQSVLGGCDLVVDVG